MSQRQVEQTKVTTFAAPKSAFAEKGNVMQRQTAVSQLAVTGSDPDTQANEVRRQTNGRLARAGQTLLQLQNQFGNRYVQQLINPQQRLTVQPKLILGEVDTPFEREADQIAAQMTSSGQVTSSPTPVNGPTLPVSPETEHTINQAKGSGQPLPESTQTPMSQSLGADLSGVRLHTDTRANSLNQALQAKAFTSGQDIFFRQGAYSPGSSGGQQLLAHELTHVVQQVGQSDVPSFANGGFIQRYPIRIAYTGLNDNYREEEFDTEDYTADDASNWSEAKRQAARNALAISNQESEIERLGLNQPENLSTGQITEQSQLNDDNDKAEEYDNTEIGFIMAGGVAKTGVDLGAAVAHGTSMVVAPNPWSIAGFIRNVLGTIQGVCQTVRASVMYAFRNAKEKIKSGARKAIGALLRVESGLRTAVRALNVVSISGIAYALSLGFQFAENAVEELEAQGKISESPRLKKVLHYISETADIIGDATSEGVIPALVGVLKNYGSEILISFKRFAERFRPQSSSQQPEDDDEPLSESKIDAILALKEPDEIGIPEEEEDFSWIDDDWIDAYLKELSSEEEAEQSEVNEAALIDELLIDIEGLNLDEDLDDEEAGQQESSNEIQQQEEIKVPSSPNKDVSAPTPRSQNAPREAVKDPKMQRVMKQGAYLSVRPGGADLCHVKKGGFVYLTGRAPQSKNNEMWVEVHHRVPRAEYSTITGTVFGWVPFKYLRRQKQAKAYRKKLPL